jgi:F-type H+-transporting ATPase subunit delta
VRDETVARNYAEALFDLAARVDQRDEYGAALETVARLLAENPQAKLFLETPRIDPDEKKKVLRSVLGDRLPKNVLNFIQLVIDKRRQRLMQGISSAYQDLLDDHLGRTHVEVTVARQFSDEAIERLTAHLSEMLGREAVAHMRVKPDVLGGIMLKTGDTVYDGTLRRRLSGIRRSLLDADLPEQPNEPAQAG